jgi:hypothetical protein
MIRKLEPCEEKFSCTVLREGLVVRLSLSQIIKVGKVLILGVALIKDKLIELWVENTPRFLINERCLQLKPILE